ncbi:hypothetical protein QJS04_geneDACA007540 [Acorus gramineus]|uniref:Uncharacterized protein n=1 Tax=Acorus gramineus TaxID=55184 RepID=A0AAV9B4J9_ACOGR|nr:hypothetical protein QJS04_geneDACA007540 [Acorus gramineus]
MNRSFRAQEGLMQRQQGRNTMASAMKKEKEEELALFLEMRKREKERNNSLLLLNPSDDLDPPLGSKPGSSPIFKITSSVPPRRTTAADDFLNSDGDKNDYDWLLTPPGTPLFPSLEKESLKSPVGHTGTPKARPTALKSRLANPQVDPVPRGNSVSRQPTSSSGLNTSSNLGTRRPSSSGGPGSTASRPTSRPATPTGRPTLPATTRPSRSSTPTSRSTLPSKPTAPPARSSTPSARSSTPSARSFTPSARSSAPSARSSTPTARPSVPPPRVSSTRSSTPTRQPTTPSTTPGSSAPPGRSSSVTKSAPTISKTSTVPVRGASPTVRSRPWKPSDMPGFSLDAPPNLRTSMPQRPTSASRGRPGAPSSRSSSVEPATNGHIRRQSCSPSRGRAPNGTLQSGSSVPAVSRLHSKSSDRESPVLIGSKMVDRVINMRRLAPPRQDDQKFANGNSSTKSPDSSGFGRTLSKKSLDMALRHMDIRRSVPGNLRPLMTNIPASSMYSVRSGTARSSRTVSVSNSPIATSSNASSEQSVNNNALCIDGSEVGDDELGSERGGRSSPSVHLCR